MLSPAPLPKDILREVVPLETQLRNLGDPPRKKPLGEGLAGIAKQLESQLSVKGAALGHFEWKEESRAIREGSVQDESCYNLNNDAGFARLMGEYRLELISAFAHNASVRSVQMANLGKGLGDAEAVAWAHVLRANPRIETLNLEGNTISSRGVLALAGALREGCGLKELKLDHQVGALHSYEAELELAQAVVEGSTRLHKLTAALRYIQTRDVVEKQLLNSAKQRGEKNGRTKSRVNGRSEGQGRLLFERSAAQCNIARGN